MALNTAEQLNYRLRVLPSSEAYCSIAQDISAGLDSKPPTLPEKYFYDARGSDLFEKICQTEDYYPTRIEDGLLHSNADQALALSDPRRIIELGSGSCSKTRKLLDSPRTRSSCEQFIAIDISLDMMKKAMSSISHDYPWLECTGIAGEYLDGLAQVPKQETGRTLYLFLGGSIGNFLPEVAVKFLTQLRGRMNNRDSLMIGLDGVKPIEELQRAYNDQQQHTSRFNLNILNVINRELDADFDLNKFNHNAEFKQELSAVQMSLISRDDQLITIGGLDRQYVFKAGDRIITEHSFKYTQETAEQLLQRAGFGLTKAFQSKDKPYLLLLAEPNSSC